MSSILDEAKRLVHGQRQHAYGHPADIYARVGRVWGAILGVPDIPAKTVCLMLAGMKVAREAERPKRDNRVDAAGYMETVQLVIDREAEFSTAKQPKSSEVASGET